MAQRNTAYAVVGIMVGIAAGCTLQEAKDDATPAPPSQSVPVAQTAPVGEGSPVPVPEHNKGEGPAPVAPPLAGGTGAGGPMAGGGPASGGPMMGGPMMGMGDPTAPLTPTPDLDKKIVDAQKGTDKKVLAVAYAARGTFRMNDDKAGPRVKYRAALDDYRTALKADPANAEAKTNKEQIEGIYKSMGRPVPGDADAK